MVCRVRTGPVSRGAVRFPTSTSNVWQGLSKFRRNNLPVRWLIVRKVARATTTSLICIAIAWRRLISNRVV